MLLNVIISILSILIVILWYYHIWFHYTYREPKLNKVLLFVFLAALLLVASMLVWTNDCYLVLLAWLLTASIFFMA